MIFLFASVYCPKGYEILSAASETCQPCSRGFYKDNSNVFGSCVSCSTGKTTEKMNSTSIESCSISKYSVKRGRELKINTRHRINGISLIKENQ